jgi:high-affinity K+ transport system ATPase subunit B
MQLVEFHSKAERKEETLRRVIIISAILGIIIPFWGFKILIGLIMFAIWRYPKKIKKVIRVLYNFK